MEAIAIKRVTKTDNYEFNYKSLKGSLRKAYKVGQDNGCTLDMIFINYQSELTDDLIKLLISQEDLSANIIVHEFDEKNKVMISDITRYVCELLKGGADED